MRTAEFGPYVAVPPLLVDVEHDDHVGILVKQVSAELQRLYRLPRWARRIARLERMRERAELGLQLLGRARRCR
jgi:hypothetical protein